MFRGRPSIRVDIKSHEWEPITTKDLLAIVQYIFESEDIRYPQSDGFLGRKKLFDAIRDVFEGKSIIETLNKHKVPHKLVFLHDIYNSNWKEKEEVEV